MGGTEASLTVLTTDASADDDAPPSPPTPVHARGDSFANEHAADSSHRALLGSDDEPPPPPPRQLSRDAASNGTAQFFDQLSFGLCDSQSFEGLRGGLLSLPGHGMLRDLATRQLKTCVHTSARAGPRMPLSSVVGRVSAVDSSGVVVDRRRSSATRSFVVSSLSLNPRRLSIVVFVVARDSSLPLAARTVSASRSPRPRSRRCHVVSSRPLPSVLDGPFVTEDCSDDIGDIATSLLRRMVAPGSTILGPLNH